MLKPITHEQARTLLQTAADQELQIDQRESLELHLSACKECRIYAEELMDLQDALQKTLHKHWNVSAQPLSIKEIVRPATSSRANHQALSFANPFITVPIMITLLFAVIIALGARHFQVGGVPPTLPLSTAALMIPTPSAKTTNTHLNAPESECDFMIYETQPNDTVDSIALKFSVSKEMLMDYNNMAVDILLPPHAQLRIPQCGSTPLASSQTPTPAITITTNAEILPRTP